MKKIFIMNLGTTSFKFKLYHFSAQHQNVLASGEIESVGAEQSAYELQLGIGKTEKGLIPIPDHGAGFAFCVDMLQQGGILSGLEDLDAVGYKAVHGGMFNKEGGLIGAGMARIPMECFEKAMRAFAAKYGA